MRYADIFNHKGEKLTLSKLILGTAVFGASTAKEDAFSFMDTYFAHGGNVLDTARVYSDWLPGGHDASERTVGEWIQARGCRGQIVLITKGAHPPMDNLYQPRVNPEAIRSDCMRSLEVLQTDYIDLYFLHRDDERVPVSVIMDALDELVQEGKIRMIGASNWRAERIMEANAYAAANGKTPFAASEVQWSYAYCTPESFGDDTLICMDEQQMELYQQMKMPILAFSSQAYGVFSRGYKADLSDLSEKHRGFYCEENIRRYQALLKKCETGQITPSQVTLDFITKNESLEGFAIIGCSSMEQLTESLNTMQE